MKWNTKNVTRSAFSSDVVNVGRRQFLIGLGGSALALPLLPSLMTKKAYAQAVQAKYFACMSTAHGGAWTTNMYPDPSTLTQSSTYAGHTISQGALALQTSGSTASLCPILTAPAATFTAALVKKMNVIQGFGYPWYIGHNTGGDLGNTARNDQMGGGGGDGTVMGNFPVVTIDQVMAFSPNFYPTQPYWRSLNLGSGRMSYVWSNIQDRTSAPQEVSTMYDTTAAFNQIYKAPTGPVVNPRTPVVNMVYQAYQRLRQSNHRLSTDDKARLDSHMSQVSELQAQLTAPPITCGTQSAPSPNANDLVNASTFANDPGSQVQAFQLMNQVIAIAFACGTSRIAVLGGRDYDFSSYPSQNWHGDVAHQCVDPNAIAPDDNSDPQTDMSTSYQVFFQGVFLDLITRLDAMPNGNGGTILDNALVQWTQECGNITHDSTNTPIITAGSAGGALATGNFLDYRDLTKQVLSHSQNNEQNYGCLLYNQWLQIALTAMGVPRSEYAQDNAWITATSATSGQVDNSQTPGGYGKLFIGTDYASPVTFPSAVLSPDILNDTPPGLKPG